MSLNTRSTNQFAACLTTLGAIAAITLASALPSPAQAPKPFHVLDTWKIGGDGFWDYLIADPANHLLYITHGARVEVIDEVTGKSAGAVTGLKGIHGVALDDTGKFGYISDGGANAVVVFDRSTFQTVASIPVGTGPDAIVFEPATKTVWSFNGRSRDATIIETATRKVVATLPLPGKPEFAAVDGTGQVFDNIEDKSLIVRLQFDPASRAAKITATWPTSPCDSPSGLAIDATGKRLFAVCDGKKMAVVDFSTGKVVATPAIGNGPDAAGYDPTNKLAFSSNGEGSLTVIDASDASYKVLQTVTTQPGARTMTVDSATGKVYVVTAQLGPRPAPTEANPHPRPAIVPGSFSVIGIGR